MILHPCVRHERTAHFDEPRVGFGRSSSAGELEQLRRRGVEREEMDRSEAGVVSQCPWVDGESRTFLPLEVVRNIILVERFHTRLNSASRRALRHRGSVSHPPNNERVRSPVKSKTESA